MRYAIISDIHSNLEGLTSVLGAISEIGVDFLLCCGDIVGYAADPSSCVELVKEKKVRCIKGNHERGLIDIDEERRPPMNPYALEAIYYSSENVTDAQRDWLKALPDLLEVDGRFYLFHGSPYDPDEYIFDTFGAGYAFRSLALEYPEPQNQLCFIGHTHICAVYLCEKETQRIYNAEVYREGKITLREGYRAVINVGSCGQYRGGIPAASFCIYDTNAGEVEFHFVEYDISLTQRKIIEAGLPPQLAYRLSLGR